MKQLRIKFFRCTFIQLHSRNLKFSIIIIKVSLNKIDLKSNQRSKNKRLFQFVLQYFVTNYQALFNQISFKVIYKAILLFNNCSTIIFNNRRKSDEEMEKIIKQAENNKSKPKRPLSSKMYVLYFIKRILKVIQFSRVVFQLLVLVKPN